ncbi:MAG: hypothetical protein K6F99_06200 [Lachnospiraceae bacterium]|nr:hypothetical protein [Lachnospiraceae bacterium]
MNEYSSDETVNDLKVDSTGTDESAVHVSGGAKVDFTNIDLTRSSSDSSGGDSASFYGVGAAFLNTDGTATINGGTIKTDSKGGAGVFSYDKGVTYVKDVVIDTTQDTSGGIHAAGGGTVYAWDLDVTTSGESSAAIRSDRGGGTMVVDGGSYTANGTGSPAVYVTADITINDATLTANNSEGLCLEGLNTVRIYDSDLVSKMPDNEQNDNTWSVILYQSMSGDSEIGEGSFYMSGGSLTSTNGGIFYSTNTDSKFYVSNVDIKSTDGADYFLKVTGNSNKRGWGESGKNGANTNFTADDQVMDGDIIWDSISKLDLYMINGSTLTGAIIDDESNAGDGGDGYAKVIIDEASKWVVTGDSTLSELHNAGEIKDKDGKSVTVKSSSGEVFVEGDSEYTITVDSYDTNADTSGAIAAESYSEYEVEMPENMSSGETVEETGTKEKAEAKESTEEVSVMAEENNAQADDSSEKSGSKAAIIALIVAGVAVVAGGIAVLVKFVLRR